MLTKASEQMSISNRLLPLSNDSEIVLLWHPSQLMYQIVNNTTFKI